MSSCWAKDDTRDTKEDRDRQAREQGEGTTNLAGNRATQQTKQNKTLGIVTQ